MNVTNKKNFGDKRTPVTYGRNIPPSVIIQNFKKLNGSTKMPTNSVSGSNSVSGGAKCPTKSSASIWALNNKDIDINSHTSDTTTKTGSTKTLGTKMPDSRVIVSVSSGRGQARQEVGIASIDIHNPTLILSQISDSQDFMSSMTTINIFNPKEILVPVTFTDKNIPNVLYSTIQKQFSSIEISAIQRSLFNSELGLNQLNNVCANEYNSVLLVLQHKFYALAAAYALIRYLEVTYNIYYTQKSIRVDYQGSEFSTLIDIDTADRLELVSCLAGNIKYSSLFGVLNHCCTPGGMRLLRANILQPPRDLIIIEQRLDCVEEFTNKSKLLSELRNILNKLMESERLVSFGVISNNQSQKSAEAQLNYILLLKSCLELIQPLTALLKDCTCNILLTTRESLDHENYKNMYNMICDVIHEDAHRAKGQAGSLQRCFAVKRGIHSLLDIHREKYSEIIEEMGRYVERLSVKYKLPLRLNNNTKKGFHISLSLLKGQQFDESVFAKDFIEIERKTSTITMTTLDIINYKQRVQHILATIENISSIVIYQILMKIKDYVANLYTFCEIIAYLDMLQSLSCVKCLTTSVRPEFSTYFELEDGFHPYLLFLCNEEPTPNSIVSTNDLNFNLITGPNMSGKSIFLKQIVLIQIMAQIGCFIFAKKAVLRIVDAIFCRIGFDDNFEFGASSFVLEMKEMQYILSKMTRDSLIIIDELCRSTTVSEGFCLAWAICEKLLVTKALIFLATHFTSLGELSDLYFNVRVFNMEVLEELKDGELKLKYTHRLKVGVTKIEKYGLRLAETSALPPSIIEEANAIFGTLAPNVVADDRAENQPKSDNQKRLSYSKKCFEAMSHINYLIASNQFNFERLKSILEKHQTDDEFMEVFHQKILEDETVMDTDDSSDAQTEPTVWATEREGANFIDTGIRNIFNLSEPNQPQLLSDFFPKPESTSMELTNVIESRNVNEMDTNNNNSVLQRSETVDHFETYMPSPVEKLSSYGAEVVEPLLPAPDPVVFYRPNTFEYQVRENFCKKRNIISSTPVSHFNTGSVASTISSGFQKMSPIPKI